MSFFTKTLVSCSMRLSIVPLNASRTCCQENNRVMSTNHLTWQNIQISDSWQRTQRDFRNIWQQLEHHSALSFRVNCPSVSVRKKATFSHCQGIRGSRRSFKGILKGKIDELKIDMNKREWWTLQQILGYAYVEESVYNIVVIPRRACDTSVFAS